MHIDNELLNQQIEDMRTVDDIWLPGPYWKGYVAHNTRVLGDIATVNNFRNRDLKGFAVGHPFAKVHNRRLEIMLKLIDKLPLFRYLSKLVNEEFDTFRSIFTGYLERLQHMGYYYACNVDTDNLLRSIHDSGIGNPYDLYTMNGKQYTLNFLRKFLHYLYVRKHINMLKVASVLEIGGGYGAQAEVILQIHPGIRYVLVDIVPQIYITECYLKTLFPGRVVGYDDIKKMDKLNLNEFSDQNIFVMASWQLPKLCSSIDLFWNCASFQEMTEEKIANYVKYIKQLGARVYSCNLKGRDRFISSNVLKKYLLPHFRLDDESAADDILGNRRETMYLHMLFSRT